ncbi:MAG: sulfite exporter TauE/SafE family protein [Bacteroidales bacterium]|nr:sulfite exporter TauE/SafE family protein [Bacteroidales bacterium]
MIFHSLFETSYLWLPFIGFIVGFFGALIGGGGGFFFLPLLIVFFDVPAQVAVPTSLAATMPICLAGSIGHYRKNNLDLRTGLIFMSAGIFGAMSGATVTSLVTATQLRIAFGIYSIILAGQMLVNQYLEKRACKQGQVLKDLTKKEKTVKGLLYGFLSGIITGTFGTSGIAPVMAGMFALRMPLRLVIGTSLMVIFGNTLSALGAHFVVGQIDLTLVYLLTIGTVVGALVGPQFLSGVSVEKAEAPVRRWYAFGMMVFGVFMIVS